MNYGIYLATTLALYGGQIIFSIIVNDIGLIFEFISAISISCLAFIFPGLFYLIAEHKYATLFQKQQGRGMRIRSWFFIIFGVLCFFFQMVANIIEIAQGDLVRGD